jgi:chaperonin GroES
MAKKLGIMALHDRVVVKPLEKAGERELPSGIILPDTVDKEKLLTGTVVAVGPGRVTDAGVRIPMEVAVGNTVVFKKPWDDPLKIEGVEYYVLGESDISFIEL